MGNDLLTELAYAVALPCFKIKSSENFRPHAVQVPNQWKADVQWPRGAP